jgi:hypothetical protein
LHALYRVGLLGYVQHDLVRGEWRQRFLRPGEATLDPNGTLPHATHYLVHPILSNVIARANPAFLQRIDRVNIVGYDRPWHEPDSNLDRGDSARSCCVLKADVHGFGALMRAGMDAPVRKALEDAVTRWAPATAIVETGAGDSALIADDDPVALAQAARHFMDDVYKAAGAAAPADRAALRRSEDAAARHRLAHDHRRRRRDPVRCPGRADRRARGDLGDGSVPRAVHAAAFAVAHDTGAGTRGRRRLQRQQAGSQESEFWVRLYRLES